MSIPAPVVIEWLDATHASSAWVPLDENHYSLGKISSLGWLVKKTAICINIADTLTIDEEMDTQKVSGVSAIPIATITSIKVLKGVPKGP